jgi:hypothetical protein
MEDGIIIDTAGRLQVEVDRPVRSSIPLGATPVCPWMMSQNPTPLIVTLPWSVVKADSTPDQQNGDAIGAPTCSSTIARIVVMADYLPLGLRAR